MPEPTTPPPATRGRPIQGKHKRINISTTIAQESVDYIDRVRVVRKNPELTPGRVFDILVNLTKGAE